MKIPFDTATGTILMGVILTFVLFILVRLLVLGR